MNENEQEQVFTANCDLCDFVGSAKTEAAAKAKVTRHLGETHMGTVGERSNVSPVSPLGKKIEELTAAMSQLTNTVSAQSDKIKEQDEKLSKQNKEREELKGQLEEKKATLSPESGPGPACEAYKVHKGEALALCKIEGDDRYEPVPAGFEVREVGGTLYVVKLGMGSEEYVSNCRSMYTAEYQYAGSKRPGQTDYPTYKAYLCKKHANTLLGRSLDEKEGNILAGQLAGQ